jgi:hypothetical protein
MECVQLLDDARLFMRDYHTTISASALQVYRSGVVRMPESALRMKTDIAHRSIQLQEIEALGDERPHWDIVNDVISDILSPDSRGALLVSHQENPLPLLNALQEVS